MHRWKNIDNALTELLKKSQWHDLDIYLVGSGMAGQLLAIAGLKNGSKRIKQITLFNAEYNYYTPELSILAQRKASATKLRWQEPQNEALQLDGVSPSSMRIAPEYGGRRVSSRTTRAKQ